MSEKPTAFILAGGKGTRLRPFTAVLPKPLVPLGDMSIIEILLTRLGAFGFKNVVVSTGHLAGLIRAVVGDGHQFGLLAEYVHEDHPLGTAGSLSLLQNSTDPIIVMNGDLLTTLDFDAMIEFHTANRADITIATFARDLTIDFGVVDSDESGEFRGFSEKPLYHFDVSMGVNVLSRNALSRVKGGKYLDMPDLIKLVAEDGGKVCCYKEGCFWLDIGRVDDYARAQEEFERERVRFLGKG